LQKSETLEQAALCARALDDFDRAAELADAIPIAASADTARMRNLLARRQPQVLIERFAEADLNAWPFWKAGEGYYLRGQSFNDTGDGQRAEADLVHSLERTTDDKARADVLLLLGRNREVNLKDEAKALSAYQQIAAMTRYNGSATYYRGVQSAARVLKNQNQLDEALQAMQHVEVAKLRGYWHGALLVTQGEILTAAGRKDEALAAFREVLADDGASAADRKAATEAIKTLEGPQ
jgi:tetratricopeptide (TPR) repeat protein